MSERMTAVLWFLIPFAIAVCLLAVVWLVVMTVGGCEPIAIEKGAVEAPVTAPVTVTTTMPVTATVEIGKDEQAPDQRSSTTQEAGHDATAYNVPVNLSGSAWGILGALALVLAFVVVRERSRGILAGNATAVTKSIAELGPGPQRDKLLGKIQAKVPNGKAWKRFVGKTGFQVKRRKHATAPHDGAKLRS